jgi:hypothetical protein
MEGTMERREWISYAHELRDTLDAALFRLDTLTTVAAGWVSNGEQWRGGEDADVASLAALAPLQAQAFYEIEAFLAAFARLSLLLFPVSQSDQARRRSEELRERLGIPADSPLASRALRDSWVHHDERLDHAVEKNAGRSGQRFALSTEVDASMKSAFLRIVEMDTLVVHHRGRNGEFEEASLRVIREALERAYLNRNKLFERRPSTAE